MAEYIDRNLIEWYGCDFEDASCENRECSDCSHAECSHAQVMQIPTANVVEREKLKEILDGYDGSIPSMITQFSKIQKLIKSED